MLGRDSDTADEDATEAHLDRIHPFVGFVGSSALAAGMTRAWYTDGGLLVVGEVKHYRTQD